MSRDPDERTQTHAMSVLLSTREGKSDRVLIDEVADWILQGSEQEHENRTAGVKAPYSLLASTTSGCVKELVKQGLSDRNGHGRVWKNARTLRQDRRCGEAH